MNGRLRYEIFSRMCFAVGESRGILSSVLSSCHVSLLLLFLIVSLTECVPTVEILASRSDSGIGEKEMAMSGSSLAWSSDDAQMEKRSADQQPIQLCGYRLLEAVRSICRGSYVGYNRRSDPEMIEDHGSMMMRDAEARDDVQHADKAKDANLKDTSRYPSHLRFRRNIIERCCRKPCSAHEILRYCGQNES